MVPTLPALARRGVAAALVLAALGGCPQPGSREVPAPSNAAPQPVPAGDYFPLAEDAGWLWTVKTVGRALDGGQLGYKITKVTKVDATTTKCEGRRTGHLKNPEDGTVVDLDDALTITKNKAGVSVKYETGGEQLWVPATMRFGASWQVGSVEALPVDQQEASTDAGSFKNAIRVRAYLGDKPGYIYFAKDQGVVTWYNRREPGVSFPIVMILASKGKGIGTVVIPSASPSPAASPSPEASSSNSPSPSPSP